MRIIQALQAGGFWSERTGPLCVICAYKREVTAGHELPPWGFLPRPVTKPVLVHALREAAGHTTQTDTHAETAIPSFNGRTMLLVEDNELNREVSRQLLEKTGAAVITAVDGQDALQHTRSRVFDLIIMDLQMPEMDGYTAAAEIRRHQHTVPIIALTASVREEDRQRAFDCGMNGFLTKPLSLTPCITAFAAPWQS